MSTSIRGKALVWRRNVHRLCARSLVTSCRGQPIERSQIFEYTNGRFLVREEAQLRTRHLNFDLDELCDIAAATGPSVSPVKAVDKYEGGYSKALIIGKEDGTEIVAKLPLPLAGPVKYTTASEVAVLEYVRLRTEVPVPRVYAWCADPMNPVRAEYILMEKAKGVQLSRVWDTVKETDRLQLIRTLVEWEQQLMSLPFPAFGSLYHRSSLPTRDDWIPLLADVDPQQRYCIGPSCDIIWQNHITGQVPGPWRSIGEMGMHRAQRNINMCLQESNQSPPDTVKGNIDHHNSMLRRVFEIFEILSPRSSSQGQTRPVLCHTDLHMGNIYVSEENPSQILSIIDWQSIQVSPLCLQARWPVFLKPPKDYQAGLVKPKLPHDYEQMTIAEQRVAQDELRQANAAKAYEIRLQMDNIDAHTAMMKPAIWRELLTHCTDTWKEGPTPLRKYLTKLSAAWSELGLPGKCPYQPDPRLQVVFNAQAQEHEEWDRICTVAKDALETDADGWISPEINLEEKVEQNNELFRVCCEALADHRSIEEVRRMWPFPDHLDR